MKIPTLITTILTQYFRYLAAGVVIVVLVIGYLSVVAPKISEVRFSQIKTRQADIDRLKQLQDNLEDLKKSNSRFAELFPAATLRTIDDFLPSDADFPGLMLTVKNLITQSGLTLNSFAVSQGGQTSVAVGATAPKASDEKVSIGTSAQAATVSGVNVKTQDVSMTVSGGITYEDFKSLLAKIESSRRLFDVVSLGFSAPSSLANTTSPTQTSSGSTWTMVLRTYYLPTTTKQ